MCQICIGSPAALLLQDIADSPIFAGAPPVLPYQLDDVRGIPIFYRQLQYLPNKADFAAYPLQSQFDADDGKTQMDFVQGFFEIATLEVSYGQLLYGLI